MLRYFVALLAISACGLMPGEDDDKTAVRTWRYPADGGHTGTFSGCEGGDWTETRPEGLPPITFQFVRRTNHFTELFDKDRNFTLILYTDGESEWSVGDGWNNWHKGTWEKAPLAVRGAALIRR